jgi:hypothetical protein
MVEFDRKGRAKAPDVGAALLTEAAAGGYTDVFVFCHGWNNSWTDAVRNYEEFVSGYGGLTREQRLTVSRPYRPLLVGIYWPSAILVAPSERGPSLFGGDVADPDALEAEQQALAELAVELDDDVAAGRFRELAARETLDAGEALELAELLRPVFRDEEDFEPVSAPPPEELVQVWSDGQGQGLWGVLVRVRDALRAATVWLMKDRAGRVGREGLGPLLAEVMEAAPGARLHLVGHSFGCRALLAAVAAAPLPRPVNSVLLLQGAVNHLCFAPDPRGDGRPGGFRPVLDKVEQPILATFSDKDDSLTKIFHLALRRAADLGEVQGLVAGAPSPYAALGGYGPGGCGEECERIPVFEVGRRYELGPGPKRLYGVDGSAAISGHSDVSNPATWWALWCQVSQP